MSTGNRASKIQRRKVKKMGTMRSFPSCAGHYWNTVVMINFTCQLDLAKGWSDTWSNVILSVFVSVFLDDINLWINGWVKQIPLQYGLFSSNWLKPWIEKKFRPSIDHKGTLPAWVPWVGSSVFSASWFKLKYWLFIFLSIFYWLCYYSCSKFSLFAITAWYPLPSCNTCPHPLLSSCPCIVHTSSLASPFPIPYLVSPCLFCTYQLCLCIPVPFPHSSSFFLPDDNPPHDSVLCSGCLSMILFMFWLFAQLFSLFFTFSVDSGEFVAILKFIVLTLAGVAH